MDPEPIKIEKELEQSKYKVPAKKAGTFFMYQLWLQLKKLQNQVCQIPPSVGQGTSELLFKVMKEVFTRKQPKGFLVKT